MLVKTNLRCTLNKLYPWVYVSILMLTWLLYLLLYHIRLFTFIFQDQLKCVCAKRLSQLTEKQAELMKKKLPQKKPIKGVKHIILVASGKGGVGKSTTAGEFIYLILKSHS